MNDCALYAGSVYVSDFPILDGYGVQYGAGYGGQQVSDHIGRCLGNTSNLTIDIGYPARKTFRKNIPYKDNILDPDFVNLSFSISGDNTKNKELAFLGDYMDIGINETSVTDEVIAPVGSFTTGDFILFRNPMVKLSTLTLKRSDTLTALTLGTHYIANNIGITMLVGYDSSISLLISYDYENQTYEELQSFVRLPRALGLVFVGENILNQSKLTLIFRHVEFNPIVQFEYLDKQFIEMNLEAAVIPIAGTGKGLSDYFIERRTA